MKIRRITQMSDPLYEKALHLYGISFPAHEQREPLSQGQILQQDTYHFDVICDNGEFVGEILYWDIGGAFYIEHFCVLPAMRNKHYGQKILNAYQPTPLILEIDPPVDDLSIRRKGFYERCGFVQHHRVKNFFIEHYDHPIWEGGVQLTDMIYLRKKL